MTAQYTRGYRKPDTFNDYKQGKAMNPGASEQGKNFSVAEIGAMDIWKSHTAKIKALPSVDVPGKLFLNPILGLTGMEVSVNCLPAGVAVPFYHKHHVHEELYLFLKGRGQFQVDGKIIEIREGTALRVSPDGERTWRNNSGEDLFYIVIQATAFSIATDGTEDGYSVQRKVVWPT
jgi:mannose-6-phosphate isomerase-like protein (cupin superfamily)